MAIQALSQVWDKFTAPHPSIHDIERRRQSRLLANIILIVLLFQILSFALLLTGSIPASGLGNVIVTTIVGAVVYLLNRNAHYVLAANIFIGIIFLVAHLSLLTESYATIYYIAMIVLVSTLLISPFTTLGLFIISVILQIIFVANGPKTFVDQSVQPLIYTILASVIVLVYTRFRLGVERERRAQLHQTIAALQKSEARWRSLVETAPDYIVELDTDYRIRYINRTQGSVGPDVFVGKPVFDYLPAEDHGRTRDVVQAVSQTLQTIVYEGMGYTPENVTGWYSTAISPIIRDGQLDGIMLLSRDISERVEAEQQRLELSMAKDRVRLMEDLIGDLSHDLKTPLTIISTSLYLLENLADPQQQREKIEQIKQQTLRLAKIIQDILTLSTLDKAPQLRLTALDFNQLVGEIDRLLRPVAVSKGVGLKLDLQMDIASIQGDEEALRRALINLVENALNYTSAPGEVTVRTAQAEHEITVEIRDTGMGIATEELPHIFDRFYRSKKARETMTGGTGLGLAIVKKTVEMHHGGIEVSSQIGIGTTFRISLPAIA